MLSRQDYKNYLDQISRLEKIMLNAYKECADRLEDVSVKKVCYMLSNAEIQHELIVKELVELINP